MNSRDYWALRSAQDIVDRMGTAEQTAAEMNRAIQQSSDYIAKEVKAVFRGMESFGISETEARKILNAAGDKTALQNLRAAAQRVSDPEKRQALLSAIDSAGAYRYRITRLEQLNKDINAECRKLYQTENRHITSALKTVANDSYYHSIFNIQQETGLGFSFAKFSQRDVDRILRANWNGGSYSQRIWKDVSATAESMKKELLVSMLSGRSNEKTARIIQERFGVNAYCARRIVRTESAYVANAAQMSAYDEAGVEKYRFIATLDSKTSEVCADLDGKVFAAKDAKPGTNYPPMHPFCRSTTIAEFGEDTLAGMERRARDEDGNVVKVPADMTYDEWYRQFVEKEAPAAVPAVSAVQPEIMRSSFIPAKTIQEAEEYAKAIGVRHVDYSDIPLETANLMNEAALTLPEDIRPAFIGSGTSIQKYSGVKFSRSANHYFGVHVDVMDMHFGEYPNITYDFDGGSMVGISPRYNTAAKIQKAKLKGNAEYAAKHDGHTQYFNTDGRSTAFHEMAHVYAEKKGIPDGFAADAKRWYTECNCDMLKSTDEAWCEAWGAYHTRNTELPDYIAKYIEKATAMPIDKSAESGIIKARQLAQKKIFNYRDFDEVIDAKSVDELKVFAADKMGISHIYGVDKLKNGNQAHELLSTVEELSQKHGKRFSRISLIDYGDNIIAAETVGNELRLNIQYLNRPGALKAVLDEWETSGYIPKGCNSGEYVAKHEYYHLLTQDMIDKPHSKVVTLVKRAVNDGCEIISENGLYDCHEFVADLLSAKTLTKSQKKLKDSIMKILETR